SMYDRSGTPSRSGVGTVITARSNPATARASSLARYCPASSTACSACDGTSSTYDSPACSRLTRWPSTSYPTTRWPTWAARTARPPPAGSPRPGSCGGAGTSPAERRGGLHSWDLALVPALDPGGEGQRDELGVGLRVARAEPARLLQHPVQPLQAEPLPALGRP